MTRTVFLWLCTLAFCACGTEGAVPLPNGGTGTGTGTGESPVSEPGRPNPTPPAPSPEPEPEPDPDPDPEPEPDPAACGTRGASDCGPGEMCLFSQGHCGQDDRGGRCVPKPGACTLEWSPVCGCDGQTYGNDCAAHAVGVSILHRGECGADTCGGFAGQSCDENEYCDYEGAPACGAADGQGVCRDRPEGCFDIFEPVCGCDGQTYGNTCEAHAAGTDVASPGACEDPEPEPVRCGGWSANRCADDEFCRYEGEFCDWADGSGLCAPRPDGCTKEYAPVCGCDGQTYANRCMANLQGVDAAFAGECR